MKPHRYPVLMLILALGGCTVSPSQKYLSRLDGEFRAMGANGADLTRSAQEAADRPLAGGQLWVAGHEDFQIEAFIRAGGVMSLKRLGDNLPGPKDVVLYNALFGEWATPQLASWMEAGAYVVRFVDGQFENRTTWTNIRPGMLLSPSKMSPTDTVRDVVHLWAWTGEFAAAVTHKGRMLTFFQSHGLPGGRERSRGIGNRVFHDDRSIPPVASGVMADAYLENVRGYLRAIRQRHGRDLKQAARELIEQEKPDDAEQVLETLLPLFADGRAEVEAEIQDERDRQRALKVEIEAINAREATRRTDVREDYIQEANALLEQGDVAKQRRAWSEAEPLWRSAIARYQLATAAGAYDAAMMRNKPAVLHDHGGAKWQKVQSLVKQEDVEGFQQAAALVDAAYAEALQIRRDRGMESLKPLMRVAEAAQRNATDAKAEQQSPNLFSLAKAAISASAEQWDDTRTQWRIAATAFDASIAQAGYEAKLRSIDKANLDAGGGEDWVKAQSLRKQANAIKDDFEQIARLYRQASKHLDQAIDAAR